MTDTEGNTSDSANHTDWEGMSTTELALRFDRSAAWLLKGEHFDGPHIGIGAYTAVATRLRQQDTEIDRLTEELKKLRQPDVLRDYQR